MGTRLRFRHGLRILHGEEKGQVFLIAAVALLAVIGFAALAVDVGFFARAKRDLQNDADAMALAGAQEIPDQEMADSKAWEWGSNNSVGPAEVVSVTFGVTCAGALQPDTITVRLQRGQPTFLARVLGITSGTLKTCATAARFSARGFIGAAPWGLEDDCLWGPDELPGGGNDIVPGEIITLKYDADNTGEDCDAHTGNFAALAIDTTGVGFPCGEEPGGEELRRYGEAICWNSVTPLEVGDLVSTETGNVISRTRDSIEYLFANVPPACDTWDEIVVNGTLRPKCDPVSEFYVGGVSIVKLIPVLDGLWETAGTSSPVPIVDFVFVVLEQPVGSHWCTGSHCDITARFVERASVPGAVRGPLDPDRSITTVALVN